MVRLGVPWVPMGFPRCQVRGQRFLWLLYLGTDRPTWGHGALGADSGRWAPPGMGLGFRWTPGHESWGNIEISSIPLFFFACGGSNHQPDGNCPRLVLSSSFFSWRLFQSARELGGVNWSMDAFPQNTTWVGQNSVETTYALGFLPRQHF